MGFIIIDKTNGNLVLLITSTTLPVGLLAIDKVNDKLNGIYSH